MPKLKIVPLTDIVPLMESDERDVAYLVKNIESTGFIRNPLALAPMGARKYIFLEQGAILEAARRLQIKQVPGQIAAIRKSSIIDAQIYASPLTESCLMKFAKMHPRAIEILDASNQNHFKSAVKIILTMADNREITVFFKRGEAGLIPLSLFNFFAFLKGQCTLSERVCIEKVRGANLKCFGQAGSLKVLNLTRDDLHFAAGVGYLFPSGLLKIDWGYRVIGLNFPVNVLNEKVSIKEKERFLFDLINYRLRSGHPSFIKSGVYLLNY